jgi:hypothetical protein
VTGGATLEVVRLAYLGLSRLILAYFLSQNTIHSTSRALFILPAEHPPSRQVERRQCIEKDNNACKR